MIVETEASLTVEAILREIARATRWSTVNDARYALLNVRRISDAMVRESVEHFGMKQAEPSYPPEQPQPKEDA